MKRNEVKFINVHGKKVPYSFGTYTQMIYGDLTDLPIDCAVNADIIKIDAVYFLMMAMVMHGCKIQGESFDDYFESDFDFVEQIDTDDDVKLTEMFSYVGKKIKEAQEKNMTDLSKKELDEKQSAIKKPAAKK